MKKKQIISSQIFISFMCCSIITNFNLLFSLTLFLQTTSFCNRHVVLHLEPTKKSCLPLSN